MYPYATITAGIALYNVATIAALGAHAIAGNRASPSFEIALPISADRGINPEKPYKTIRYAAERVAGRADTNETIIRVNAGTYDEV